MGMAPFQSSLAGSYMNSLGLGGGLGLMNEASNRGFGGANNPTAPALSQTALGLASLGIPPFRRRYAKYEKLGQFLGRKVSHERIVGSSTGSSLWHDSSGPCV